MAFKILTQLQNFLSQPEVTTLYSCIHELHQSKLEEALRIRGLSMEGDESIFRVRLLRYEVQFFYPKIQFPWDDNQNKVSNDEAVNLQMKVDALRDLTRALCVENTDGATPNDAQAIHTDTEKLKTATNASVTSGESSHKDGNIENQVKYRLNCVKLLKICNLQYTGERGLPAQDFLENLDDFRKFSKISERVLLEILACVFDIDTKKWYRANNFNDWQSFEQKFVENYVCLNENVKQQTTDRATQTDNLSFNETRNRVVVPSKKSVVVRVPVSKTLQDLKDSLSNIGLKASDYVIKSKKSNISTVVSSNSDVKASIQCKMDGFTQQVSNINETIGGCPTSKSNTPTTSRSTSQSPINVIFQNVSSLASVASSNTAEDQFQDLTQMINTVQSSINSQSNTLTSNSSIGSTEPLTIADNSIIRNFTNSNKPNLTVVKPQAVISQNNPLANYTVPSSSAQSSNNNVVTSVNQGQITYHSKPVDSKTLLLTQTAPSNGGCYLYARHDCNNASNLSQEYLTNQPLNYGFGTYYYPMDYYMSNGYGHR